ncbi:MAG: hypothetical protein PHS92_05055 [Candidatus Gracilibacteria bacterium]|nr:hypothetical protein [Candidatus Gracilibacteria bacterium]
MKKLFIPAFVIVTLLLASCGTSETTNTDIDQIQGSISVQPERKVDIYGKVLSVEGNEITLLQIDTSKDPTFNMSPTEKKKYMMAMDEAARMALKEEINSATLGEVKIMIPVGIPMIRKTAQGPDAPNAEASLADIKNGQYISVWLSSESKADKTSEFVKIAFTQ